jgi:15,16-dihydrobiliverdin:ferredoxin oxidoreductase
MLTILKYLGIFIVPLVILAVIITSVLRSQGERMYARYDSYTREALAKNFQLQPYPIKAEFQYIAPWKALKLFQFRVDSKQSDRLARINNIDATMFRFIKMYTLLLRPAYDYNLPMLSVDIIAMGGKRVYVMEVIDPARIDDANKNACYEKMRKLAAELKGFAPVGVRDWYKDFLADVSIHANAKKEDDDKLFYIFQGYLDAYIETAKNAQKLDAGQSMKVRQGFERYVTTLLGKGGPAVDVFKKLLGPEKQQEYIRTVMFGLN